MHSHLAATTLVALLAPVLAAQTTLHAWQGSLPSEAQGYSIANAGDVDGDGFDDVIVGSPFYDVYFPTGIADAGKVTVRSGATGQTLFTKVGAGSGYQLGFDVDGAGDVNADGYADVIMGVPGDSSGGFIVSFGPDGALSLPTTLVQQQTIRFGSSVAGCGDANGDGYDDVVIGSPYETIFGPTPDSGRVRVYDVFHQHVIAYADGSSSGGHLGWSVAGVGDVDGDGLPDVLVGEPHHDGNFGTVDSSGRAFLYSPATSPMTALLTLSPSVVAGGTEFGYAVSGGGLINGDGVPDLVIGVPGINGNTGTVSVRSGATGSILTTIFGSQSGERYGAAVAGGGDFDGDGLADVVVGAPSYDVLPLSINRGRIEVRRALGGALLHSASSLSGGKVGFAVDIGAHCDIDARDEILYGAPDDDSGATNAGATWVVSSSNALAAIAIYGAGLAGTLGVPQLDGIGAPSLGTDMQVVLSSSSNSSQPAILALGLEPAALAFKGGALLITPLLLINLGLPPGSLALPLAVPADAGLLGGELFLQLWQGDPGAILGVALSPGMRLTFGE